MKHRFALLSAVTASLLVGACGGIPHKIQTETMSPKWEGTAYKNLLIIGVYDDRTYRVSAETAFAEELKGRGITAEPTHDVVADLKSLEE